MNGRSIVPTHWPDLPPLPRFGEPVLVRVKTAPLRSEARQQVRVAAREILAEWSKRPAGVIEWRETPRGPICEPTPDHPTVSLSFSYDGGAGWIGLVRGGTIGIDAMKASPFAEMPAVARLYLGPIASDAIAAATDPARAFALAWTEMEARTKLLRRDLTEWAFDSGPGERSPFVRHRCFDANTVVTVLCAGEQNQAPTSALPVAGHQDASHASSSPRTQKFPLIPKMTIVPDVAVSRRLA